MIVLLAGVGGFLSYRAKAKTREVMAQYDADRAKIDKVDKRITEARATGPGNDKCIAAINDRLAKAHAAKDDAPKTVPASAVLLCDTTSWQTGCRTPPMFANNTAFDATTLCADPTVAARQRLDELTAKRPYPRDKNIDAWSKDVDDAIASLKDAQDKLKPPSVVVAMASSCEATALESFVDNVSGARRQLEANTCQVSLTWVDASGAVLGRLKATGHGNPPDSARKSMTLSDSELDGANDESERNGIDDGFAQVQKRIDQINKKGPGPATPSTPSAPKSPATPPKTPAPKSSAPAPKAPTPAPPPKKK